MVNSRIDFSMVCFVWLMKMKLSHTQSSHWSHSKLKLKTYWRSRVWCHHFISLKSACKGNFHTKVKAAQVKVNFHLTYPWDTHQKTPPGNELLLRCVGLLLRCSVSEKKSTVAYTNVIWNAIKSNTLKAREYVLNLRDCSGFLHGSPT